MKLWETMRITQCTQPKHKKTILNSKDLELDYNVSRIKELVHDFETVLNFEIDYPFSKYVHHQIRNLFDIIIKNDCTEYIFSFSLNMGTSISPPPSKDVLTYIEQEFMKSLKHVERKCTVDISYKGYTGYEEDPPPLYFGGPLDTYFVETFEVIVKIFD